MGMTLSVEGTPFGGRLDNIGKAAFYLALLTELCLVILDKSALSGYVNSVDGWLFRITFVLFGIKLVCTRYTGREWLWLLLFGLLGAVSYLASGRNEILRITVFAAACKNVPLRKLFTCAFVVTLAGSLLLAALSLAGVMGSVSMTGDYGRMAVENRYCLGMGHPNALHCMFLMLLLLALYLYGDRMKWYHYLLLAASNLGMFALTDSKTGMAMGMLAVAGAFLMRYMSAFRHKKWVAAAAIAVFLLCVGFSVLAAAVGDTSQLLAQFDLHINGRIHALYDTVNHEGMLSTWSLFSSPGSDHYFDMGFVRVFYWYGILPGIIYVIINVILIWHCYKEKDDRAILMMTVLAVYTVVEAHIVSVYIGRNYSLFLLGAYWGGMLHARKGREIYLWRILRHESKE